MPISIRLPADIEAQVAGFGSRTGLTKSAVIVRSIQEFLARNAAPSSLQIYEQVMLETPDATDSDALRAGLELRPVKLAAREALQKEHAERSERALRALAAQADSIVKAP